MPLEEFYEHIENLNKENKRRAKQFEEPSHVPQQPKPIGEVIPGRSKI